MPVRCKVETKHMYMCALSVLFCLAENHFPRVRVELRRVKFLHFKYLFTKIVYTILLFVVSWQRTAPGRGSAPPFYGWTCSTNCLIHETALCKIMKDEDFSYDCVYFHLLSNALKIKQSAILYS